MEHFSSLVIYVGILLLGCLSLTGCHAKTYTVGDSAGWTTIGNIDYKNWAATKTFRLGDVIHFQYNPKFHNVMRVTHEEFRSCNTSSPMETHNTGNDSIKLTTGGHHFFLCGIPGHCQSGQKVDIHLIIRKRDTTVSSSPSTSPTSSVSSSSPTVSSSPASSTDGGNDNDGDSKSPAPSFDTADAASSMMKAGSSTSIMKWIIRAASTLVVSIAVFLVFH